VSATLFPQAFAVAATGNPGLMRRSGETGIFQARIHTW